MRSTPRRLPGRVLIALQWAVLVLLALYPIAALAQRYGLCKRCVSMVKIASDGFGTIRTWEGLCGACQDPTLRCTEALRDLERRIELHRDNLGHFRFKLRGEQRAIQQWEMAGRPENETHYGDHSCPASCREISQSIQEGGIDYEQEQIRELTETLNRMRAECAGEMGRAGAGGRCGGDDERPADAAAGEPQGTAPIDPAARAAAAHGRAPELKRISDRLQALRSDLGPTFPGAADPAVVGPEAAYLFAARQYVGPLVDAAAGARKEPSKVEPAAAGPDGAARAEAEEDRTRPQLLNVDNDLPDDRLEAAVERLQRVSTNAARLGAALLEAGAGSKTATPRGAEIGGSPLERGIYLSFAGQQEHRRAQEQWVQLVRVLHGQGQQLQRHLQTRKLLPEQAFERWQAEVRKTGLPPQLLLALQKANFTDEETADYRDRLLAVKPLDAARGYRRFQHVIAPSVLPEARARPGAAAPGAAVSRPREDADWALIGIRLAKLRRQAAAPGANARPIAVPAAAKPAPAKPAPAKPEPAKPASVERPAGPVPANAVIRSVETRWPDVYCDLMEVSRPASGELMVRWRYRNIGKTAFRFPDSSDLIPATRALDPQGRKVYGPLKDSGGKVLGSTTVDSFGTGKSLASRAAVTHWVKLEAPPEGVPFTLLVLGATPLEVPPGTGPSQAPMTAPRKAVASQDMETEGLVAEVLDVRRAPGGMLNVIFRYRYTGGQPYRFPDLSNEVPKAYVVEPDSRKKYEVVRDQDGYPLCGTTLTASAALPSGATLTAGDSLTAWAKFEAPAESAKKISFFVVGAPPFEGLEIAGAGAEGAGQVIAGAVVGLDQRLKELGAKVTEKEVRIAVEADVLFDFDKAEVKMAAEPALLKVATVLRSYPAAEVIIEGHTDNKGADAYNQRLSERRAAAVRDWLAAREGLENANLATRGFGAKKPVAPNQKADGADDPEARRKNRRVEIVVLKAGAE